MNKSLLENNIKLISDGLDGLLHGVNSMLSNLPSELETETEKKEFADKLKSSGILKELADVQNRFKEVLK